MILYLALLFCGQSALHKLHFSQREQTRYRHNAVTSLTVISPLLLNYLATFPYRTLLYLRFPPELIGSRRLSWPPFLDPMCISRWNCYVGIKLPIWSLKGISLEKLQINIRPEGPGVLERIRSYRERQAIRPNQQQRRATRESHAMVQTSVAIRNVMFMFKTRRNYYKGC